MRVESLHDNELIFVWPFNFILGQIPVSLRLWENFNLQWRLVPFIFLEDVGRVDGDMQIY